MDKDKQAQIIYEMSKDSAYFKRAAKLDAEADVKVQGLKKILLEVKGPLEDKLRKDVQRMILDLEPRRSFRQICCVLDMDMFYAAVEIRDKPHLKDLPVAVGGMSMISTANYVARKFGVRAAMPGFIAKKLCPQLVFVDMNFDKYRHISEQVKDIIGEYDPDFTSHSLDEVYFDLTNEATNVWQKRRDGNHTITDAIFESVEQSNNVQSSESKPDVDIFALRAIAVELLQEIRRRITEVTCGLTCSAGLANNHYLAKIGADVNKPDGQFELPPTREAVMEFVTTLATRKVTGIGKVTERMLDSLLGAKTMGQVRDHLPQLLHTLSPIMFQFLLRTCMGIGSHEGDDSVAQSANLFEKKTYMRKSLGCERTFASKGISDPTELYARLHKICQHVAEDMASEGLWAKAVTLKLKNVEFELITRIASSPQYFQSVEVIESLAKAMLDEALPVNIRLMGVSVSKFKQPDVCEADPKQRNMLMFLKAKEEQENEQTKQQGSVDLQATSMCSSSSSSSSSEAAANCVDGTMEETAATEGEDGEEGDSEVEILDNFVGCSSNADQMPAASHSDAHSADTRIDSKKPTLAGHEGTWSVPTAMSRQQQQQQQQLHECPVCGAQVPGMLIRFNQHLDRCLGLGDPQTIENDVDARDSGASKTKGQQRGKGQEQKKRVKSAGVAALPSVKAANIHLFASFNTAAITESGCGSSSTTAHKGMPAQHVPSSLQAQKRPRDITISSSNKQKSSSSSSSADNPRHKAQRQKPLALEITDYFTYQ